MSTLTIEHLTAGYGERLVLRDVSISVRAGELVVLVGPNGVGKSTLIRAVSGVIAPREGIVLVGGENVLAQRASRRARKIAVVPQAVNLPDPFTVAEIVLMGRNPHLSLWGREGRRDHEVAGEAMRVTEVLDLATRRVGELSGGEKQRVTLARALAQEPRVLLLDEATAHLDLHHQIAVLDLVKSLAKEKELAVLATLHDLNQASLFADRIVLLAEGALRAQGSPREVFTAEILTEAYRVPVHVIPHPTRGTPLVLPDVDAGSA